jgi:hypothetical protein
MGAGFFLSVGKFDFLGACVGRAAGVVYWTGPGLRVPYVDTGDPCHPFSYRGGMKQRHPPNPILGTARVLDSRHMIDENSKCAMPVARASEDANPASQATGSYRTRRKSRVRGSAARMFLEVLTSGPEVLLAPILRL